MLKYCLSLLIVLTTFVQSSEIDYGNSRTLKRIVKEKSINIGVHFNDKTFSCVENGKRVGIDIDFAKILAEELGVELNIIVPNNFNKLIPTLRDDKIDIIITSMTSTFERSKLVDFTKPSFYTGIFIMLNKSKGAQIDIGKANSHEEIMSILEENGTMNELIITVREGMAPESYIPIFFKGATVKKFKSRDEAAKAVVDGEAHIMIHDEFFLKRWAKDNLSDNSNVVVLEKPFKQEHYAFAIKKDNQDFLNMMNIFIDELYTEGNIKAVTEKFLD